MNDLKQVLSELTEVSIECIYLMEAAVELAIRATETETRVEAECLVSLINGIGGFYVP